MLLESKDEGVMFFCEPIPLTKDNVTATNIPVSLPAWATNTLYPIGALVSKDGRSFQSVLEEAVSYKKDCPKIFNVNQNPTLDPPPHVPYGAEDTNTCEYRQAGMAWWTEIDPGVTYVEAMFNHNLLSQAPVDGNLTITISPGGLYDTVAIFGVRGETATLTADETYFHDLYLWDREIAVDFYDYGPEVVHSDHVVWLLDAPVSGAFTVEVAALSGRSAIGNLLVGRRSTFGMTLYNSTVGIVNYSKKDRDVFGNMQLIPRWYQDKVTFLVQAETARAGLVKQLLTQYRNTPCLYVGHDNPERYELQILGLIQDVGMPIMSSPYSLLELTVEEVGVPVWVSGIPHTIIPPPPPKPDVPVGPWLAIGHDEWPYITIVDSVTWEKVKVNFVIPSPAYAVLFSYDQEYLFIGTGCPPYLTIVTTSNWTALDLPGPEYLSGVSNWDSDFSSSNGSSSGGDWLITSGVQHLALSPPGLYQNELGDRGLLGICQTCPPYFSLLSVPDWNLLPIGPFLTHSGSRSVFDNTTGRILVTDSCQNRVVLGNPAAFDVISPLASKGRTGLFTASGNYLVLAAKDPSRLDWVKADDLVTVDGTVPLPGEAYIIKQTEDTRYLAVGHRCAPYVTIIDLATREKVTTYFTLEYGVCSLDFTEDGLYLAAVFKHHPYCMLIKTANWSEFPLAFLDDDDESSL